MKTGSSVKPLEEGELYVKGPTLFNGYLGAAAGEGLDSEGWLHTGDFAMYDSDKNFYIRDRLKMLMKCEGCQVRESLATHVAQDDVRKNTVRSVDFVS